MATNNAINATLVTNGVVKGNSTGASYDAVTITAGAVLAANSSGVPTSSAALTLNALVLGGGTGIPTVTAAFSANGQLAIGNGSSAPSISTLTAGSGISVTNGAGSITIAATGNSPWTEVTGTSQSMAVNNGYIASNAGLVTLTLPTTAAVGDEIHIAGKGAGGYLIAQNASQLIHLGNAVTTTGVAGSLASSNQWDSINLLCVTANNVWTVIGGPQGNFTVV